MSEKIKRVRLYNKNVPIGNTIQLGEGKKKRCYKVVRGLQMVKCSQDKQMQTDKKYELLENKNRRDIEKLKEKQKQYKKRSKEYKEIEKKLEILYGKSDYYLHEKREEYRKNDINFNYWRM